MSSLHIVQRGDEGVVEFSDQLKCQIMPNLSSRIGVRGESNICWAPCSQPLLLRRALGRNGLPLQALSAPQLTMPWLSVVLLRCWRSNASGNSPASHRGEEDAAPLW